MKKAKQHAVSDPLSKMMRIIEKSLVHPRVYTLRLKDKKLVHVYPHRLAYVDGKLSLIAEDCAYRCLNSFIVQDIAVWKKSAKKYEPNFTTKAVDHFMTQVRAVAGNEVRLVLKVVAGAQADLLDQHHFFRRPYIASNHSGELIWGAWVEISQELFDWLYQIRSKINILDPISVKKAFQRYCDKQARMAISGKSPELALKKAG